MAVREYYVILYWLDADPRQSAVTLPSNPETNVSCLAAIEISGLATRKQNWGSTWDVSRLLHAQETAGTRGGAADPAHQCRFAVLYPGYDNGLDCFRISSSVSDLRLRHCGSGAALLRGTDFVGSAF